MMIRTMMRPARFVTILTLFIGSVVTARAGTLHGTIRNATTGKPAANTEVVLIQLQGGMQPVANTKTDASGQFSFDNPSLGAQPMLVRAVYQGVNFHQPVPPGKNEIQVDVFDTTQDVKTIDIPSHLVVLQPNGSILVVGEEYAVQNKSNPPLAFFRADGTFNFAVPENAQLKQAAAWGPSGMPVVQATIDKSKNRYAIAFAFRPGENGVRYFSEVPYAKNTATIKIPSVYPGARLAVLAPPSMQVSGDGLVANGQEQGMSVYVRESGKGTGEFSLNVSGTAPPAAAEGGPDAGGAPTQDAQQGTAARSGVTVEQIPGRLDVLKWPLVAGFVGLFALGGIILARKPVAVVATVGPSELATPPMPPASPKIQTSSVSTPAATSPLAQVDAAVGTNLESLKDRIFRLELRHQAGTISEEEYTRERAAAEKVLRDLVRG
jgi:hypothetical protein